MADGGEGVCEFFGFGIWEGFRRIVGMLREVNYFGQFKMVHLYVNVMV